MTSAPYQSLQENINSLGTRMEKNFDEIKELLRGQEARLRDVENDIVRSNTATDMTLKAAWKRIDEHANSILDIKKELSEMAEIVKFINTVERWMLGIFTSVFVAFLILVISGKVTLIFK